MQSGSHRRHGFHPWVGKTPWRRAQQPTPVFLPGESHGQRSLGGYSPWGLTESDTTEVAAGTEAFPHFLPLSLSWIILDCFSLVPKLLNNLVFAWCTANRLQTPLCEFKLPNANKILTCRVKQCVEETCFTSTYWWTWCIGSINIVLSMKKHGFQINKLFYFLHFSSLDIFFLNSAWNMFCYCIPWHSQFGFF